MLFLLTHNYTGYPMVREACEIVASRAIGNGEFFMLLGPSGCGKTTSLRMIAGWKAPCVDRHRAYSQAWVIEGLKMFWKVNVIALLTLGLSACQTTQDASRNMRGAWIGQPVDAFFVENGPPVSSYLRRDGGTIYTWRGGEASYVRPAQVQHNRTSPQTLATTSRTSTSVSNPSPGTRVTRSTTTSFSLGVPQLATTQVIRPAQRIELVCEAQISVDDEGIIESLRISRDTEGEFLSFSRCADIFRPA